MFKYSAIVTTYNAENTIHLALASILQQDIGPAEVIVVDDFSTDTTFEKISKYATEYPQLKIYRNAQNTGVAITRNFALNLATESYVVFFDDDDVSLSHRARTHSEHFAKNADVSYVSSLKKYANGFTVHNISDDYEGFFEPSEFAKRQLLGEETNFMATPASCMAIKREMALQIGGFDSKFRRLEDADIAIRLAISKANFAFSSRICVERFDLGKSISTHEGVSQEMILLKYRYLLTSQQFHEAAFKVEVRNLYFNKKVLKLFMRVIKEILMNPHQIRYLFRGLKRIKHDWSKK